MVRGPGPQGCGRFHGEPPAYSPARNTPPSPRTARSGRGLAIALGLGGPVGPAIVLSGMVVAQTTVHVKNGFYAAKGGIGRRALLLRQRARVRVDRLRRASRSTAFLGWTGTCAIRRSRRWRSRRAGRRLCRARSARQLAAPGDACDADDRRRAQRSAERSEAGDRLQPDARRHAEARQQPLQRLVRDPHDRHEPLILRAHDLAIVDEAMVDPDVRDARGERRAKEVQRALYVADEVRVAQRVRAGRRARCLPRTAPRRRAGPRRLRSARPEAPRSASACSASGPFGSAEASTTAPYAASSSGRAAAKRSRSASASATTASAAW